MLISSGSILIGYIVAKCPDLAGTVPIFRPMSRLAQNSTYVPEYLSIAQIGVWHKHKLCILSNFGPYISIFSGRGTPRSPQVGVVDQKWAWSGIFASSRFARIINFVLASFLVNLATMWVYIL
jgi:hypothetical protein